MFQDRVTAVGSTQFVVGLSQVLRWTPPPNLSSAYFKIGSGGGTLEIVPVQFSGTSTATGNAWGKGYPLGATEVYQVLGAAAIYLAATGATMTVAFGMNFSAGATAL